MKKNSQHIVQITSVTEKGFGVGNIGGMVVFIDGALPGETVEAQIVKVKTRYCYGKTLNIITPAPARIESPCPHAAKCGGCQFQHCAYPVQLEVKKRLVTDVLIKIGGQENPPVADVLGMEGGQPQRYRNKAVFPIVPADNAKGFAIGMYAPRSHRIIELTDCIIQHHCHIEILQTLSAHMQSAALSPYNETTHKGLMRYIIVRNSLSTGEVMVVLVINGQTISGEEQLCAGLTAAGASTVIISPNTTRGNTIMGSSFRVLSGAGYIHENIGDVKYQLSAPSFFQVNPVQVKSLYDAALSQAGLTGQESVLDAHVGVGGIALYAAKHAREVIGIDIVQPAIDDAVKNAALNGIQNASFLCGAAEEIVPQMLEEDARPDIIFLDPPRKGCDPALLAAIIAAQIPKIVYISCDPATLARDVKMLTASGYTLKAAQPVDMFPHTGKVEVSCLLELH
ncbi:MAG: 23S rRNA (uracil(1939)-C(5))-methyltransferase RlmD [Defluviitaleaceae bacterium]|nr:23S rRNA (uracil(1939)-C(5))-methyltransferase RlmD [Defluviitaleaceae bacterium]